MSDASGRIELSVAGMPATAVAHCGFYRVEISQKDGGKERIPVRFNSETMLGLEIAEGDKKRVEGFVFDVTSK
jgi:hypothetical protein